MGLTIPERLYGSLLSGPHNRLGVNVGAYTILMVLRCRTHSKQKQIISPAQHTVTRGHFIDCTQ